MNTRQYIGVLLSGVVTALTAYDSADRILAYNTARHAVLESRLTAGSTLTRETLKAADSDARKNFNGTYAVGFGEAALAGLFGTMTLYLLTRKEDE